MFILSPRHSKLCREVIIQTALALVDEYGVEELSMRSIARNLNFQAMSLYNYVKNKDEVLDGIVELITCKIKISQSSDWKVVLRNTALSFYEILSKHPNVLPIVSTHSPITKNGIKHMEELLSIFKNMTRTKLEALSIVHIMLAYVIGYAEISMTPQKNSEWMKDTLNLQEFPNTYGAYLNLDQRNKKDEFLYGVDLLLEGLERKFEKKENEI